MTIIRDGTGNGFAAKVGSDNRLAVDAITESIDEKASLNGDAYNIATTRAVLTSTNESALFYIKNNEENDLILKTVFINTSESQGTLVGAQPTLKIYRNPVAGTIIDNQLPAIISNRNFGSAKIIDVDVFGGAEGDTFTQYSSIIEVPLPSRGALTFTEFSTTVILPKGASYGISYQPETGSTSVDVISGVTLIKVPKEFA